MAFKIHGDGMMKRSFLIVATALTLSGCTVFQEALSRHRELKSPCVCADDATPINIETGGLA
jgi:starvation-inducible outer membrane lipoprotein